MSETEDYIDDAEDLVPLGEVLELRTHELAGFERRAKRAAARVQSHLGGPDDVVRLDAAGTRKKTSWREFLLYNKENELRATEGNTLTILENDEQFAGCLVLDKFRAQWVWVKQPPGDLQGPFPRPMRPEDVHYCQQWLERSHNLVVGHKVVAAKLSAVASRNSVDALATYLEDCEKKWDRRPRINMWLSMCAGVSDTPHARAVGRKWLIGCAARGIDPGAKLDTVLVLEGPQGAKKSTLLNVLAGGHGEHGQSWHTDNVPLDVESKDAAMALAGHLIVEFAELDRWRRSDRSAFKDFVSKRVDKFRPPYAAETVSWPRRCGFAATVNAAAYLDDATGARRFWIVRIDGTIRLDLVRKYRDQLWGEAAHYARRAVKALAEGRADTDSQWWLTPEEEALARAETDERYSSDPWEAELQGWAESQPYLTARDALRQLKIDPGKATRADQMRLGDVFLRLGFGEGVDSNGQRCRRLVRIGTAREYRFYPSPLSLPLSLPPDRGSDKNPSNIGDVTTVTTVTTSNSHVHTRARDLKTGSDSSDGSDNGNNAGDFVTTSPDRGSDKGGDKRPVQLTIAEIWGEEPEWGGA